ncbi:MAG: indolepyruvate oxidoreductase subunit beta [Bacteroidales bacterium]|nr:MAG: indolepyruvate oxidoreductase subunit beta [Bacteroidales bacterium]
MKKDIILAGVGGQGILTIAASIGLAALEENLELKQAEVHGMSQRGGAVQSHLRISDKDIASDLIPLGKADLVLSVEPLESLRYLPYLCPDGWLVTNSTPFVNIPDYPEMEDIRREIQKIQHHLIVDADRISKDIGSTRSSNIVMLGAASSFIGLETSLFEAGIDRIFRGKGEAVVRMNIRAFQAGREYVEMKLSGKSKSYNNSAG